MSNPDTCEHNYESMGLQWWNDEQQRAGTGATTIRYVHTFFCTKCCDTLTKPADFKHDSYTKTLALSTPVSQADALNLRRRSI
jgi:hypothetical protein